MERERVRVEASEDIAAARAAAERGAHEEAVRILENRQRAVEQSEAARGGDPTSAALGAELREMRMRVANRASYHRSGRAYVLAGISSHAHQRANWRPMEHQNAATGGLQMLSAVVGCGVGEASVNSIAGWPRVPSFAAAAEGTANEANETSSFATPAMRAMLLRSRKAREASAGQQQQPEEGEGTASSGPIEETK